VKHDGGPLEPFPLPEHHDTDRSPLPPEDEMPEAKPDRSTMTTDQKLDAILDRLEEGDRRFDRMDTDWTIAMNFMHEVALERGREDLAQRIRETVAERRPNGAVDHDVPTNPSNGRPPDA
jgi:hypothetical protein